MSGEVIARRFLRGLFWTEAAVAVLAFLAIAAALFADVASREILHVGIFGAQRFAVYCMIVGAMLGFAIAVSYATHMRITVADGLVPERWNQAVNRLADLVSAGVCTFLGYWSFEFVQVSFEQGARGMALDVLLWPIQSVLTWVFLSAAARYVIYALYPPLRPVAEAAG